jgi:hypothetical protein
LGFDGGWVVNARELQEDFGWRSIHVVTLIGKAITEHCCASRIRISYVAGNSKGGQAMLMEAQRFPLLTVIVRAESCDPPQNDRDDFE